MRSLLKSDHVYAFTALYSDFAVAAVVRYIKSRATPEPANQLVDVSFLNISVESSVIGPITNLFGNRVKGPPTTHVRRQLREVAEAYSGVFDPKFYPKL